MSEPEDLEQLRGHYESLQKNVLQEDGRRNAPFVSAALWKINSGSWRMSILYALLFLFLAIGITAIPFVKDFSNGTFVAILIALAPLFLAFKLFVQDYSWHKSAQREKRSDAK